MPSERAPGWYWVRTCLGSWIVAKWCVYPDNQDIQYRSDATKSWWICGEEVEINAEVLSEIGERIPDHE